MDYKGNSDEVSNRNEEHVIKRGGRVERKNEAQHQKNKNLTSDKTFYHSFLKKCSKLIC